MNQHLQNILNIIQQSAHLNEEEKAAISTSVKDADKELEITAFKLERTENVKRTTAILLEETIEELEQKRKAVEVQNRKLEIETALERVRSIALSMNDPTDMLVVCKTISQQLELLHVKEIRNVQTAIIYEDKGAYLNYEYYTKHDKLLSTEVDYRNHTLQKKFAEQMLTGADELFIALIKSKEVKEWYEYQKTTNQFADIYLENAESLNYYWYSLGPVALGMSTYVALSEEDISLFKRFRNVFELAYRRFLDIEKALAQAREAQIETALEKVRSRSLAMYKTDELKDVVKVVFEKLKELGLRFDGGAGIQLFKENSKDSVLWTAALDQISAPSCINLPYAADDFIDNPIIQDVWKAKETGEAIYNKTYNKEEKNKYFNYVFKHNNLIQIPQSVRNEILQTSGYTQAFAIEKNSCVIANSWSGQEFLAHEFEIFKRIARVFEQAYIRFLDLQKAEAQAREAQIEVALERVRSRTMAMQKSNELTDVASSLFAQVTALGIKTWTSGFNLWSEDNNSYVDYITSPNGGFIEPYTVHTEKAEALKDISEARKSGVEFEVLYVEGGKIKKLYQALTGLGEKQFEKMLEDGVQFPSQQYEHFVFGSKVSLMFITYEQVPEAHDIFKRLGKVFEQTYTRFLDLQKAEAQAREALIEAALERVRSRTMAMHKSDELQEVSRIIIQQIVILNLPLFGFGIHICHEKEPVSTAWIGDPTKGQVPTVLYEHTHDSLSKLMYKGWKDGESLLVKKVSGEELKEHFEYMVSVTPIRSIFEIAIPPEFIIYHFAYFLHGFFVVAMLSPYEEAQTILKRFAKVFEQAYTRFLDLQKVEAQARESQIETGLERVRSRTLAMQKSDELPETSVVAFKELINLGIEPNRLFIGIINDKTRNIEAWASNEEGTKIGKHFTLNTAKNETVDKMYAGWKEKKKSLTIDITGKNLQNYFHYLAVEMKITFKGGLLQKRRVQNIAYFSKGLIGMASPDEQPKETIFLLERFAAVFNLTYTRFNDLKISERNAIQAEQDLIAIKEAKQKAEEALIELQAAQKQLIQSEKMASLGELTAGIAHEIQNPLNFVNNFSEVSKELLDEMKIELDKGNNKDAKEIANDVIQNLEKINHHGKRADAIVKGMLQHSRSSIATKEPTDINALTDEYIRLCYHGLRAKDKSFNATIKTNFDNSIEKINIIPQDIGRVVLNLLTNAFYAVDEKKKAGIDGYEPTVTVSTSRSPLPGKGVGGEVKIIVTDNGKGIPQKVLDKIFQPFFTTKPTGQGTGLGLSLSYDIIKAHGGELKVETKEGEGSTFIIQLPVF